MIRWNIFTCLPLLVGGVAAFAHAADAVRLLPTAQVDSKGVYLSQIVSSDDASFTRPIQIAPAPSPGQALVLTRAQINQALAKANDSLSISNWTGSERVRVTRKMRRMDEAELKLLLGAALQRDFGHDRGQLELRFTRQWTPIAVPDEPLALRVVDMPSAGLTPNFIVRFELRTDNDTAGSWQAAVQARLMHEVLVARSTLYRGEMLRDADIGRESRDLLTLRDALVSVPENDSAFEVAETLPAGAVLGSRSVRLRPVVRRGKLVDAVVQDGSLMISAKVEVLEDGVPGQTVRVRNVKSRKEFRGKVQNEELVQVGL